jgi:hypothetical protein
MNIMMKMVYGLVGKIYVNQTKQINTSKTPHPDRTLYP